MENMRGYVCNWLYVYDGKRQMEGVSGSIIKY